MPTVKPVVRSASAHFVITWDEAIALQKQLPLIRKAARERFNVDHLEIRFVNPWGGLNHTEVEILAEVAKSATAVVVAGITKWLLRVGKDFLKHYRKQGKQNVKPNAKRRTNKPKKGT